MTDWQQRHDAGKNLTTCALWIVLAACQANGVPTIAANQCQLDSDCPSNLPICALSVCVASGAGAPTNNSPQPSGGAPTPSGPIPTITAVTFDQSTVTFSVIGTNLATVTQAYLSGGGLSANVALGVSGASATAVQAFATSALNLVLGATYNLVVATAGAETGSASVNITITPGSVSFADLATSGCNPGTAQTLAYDGDASIICEPGTYTAGPGVSIFDGQVSMSGEYPGTFSFSPNSYGEKVVLWGASGAANNYEMGIEPSISYDRVANGAAFVWYAGGSYSSGSETGSTILMTLSTSGLTVNTGLAVNTGVVDFSLATGMNLGSNLYTTRTGTVYNLGSGNYSCMACTNPGDVAVSGGCTCGADDIKVSLISDPKLGANDCGMSFSGWECECSSGSPAIYVTCLQQ